MQHEAPKIAATVVLGVLVAVFILRDPIVARLGAAAPMAAILAAWLAAPAIPPRGDRNHARLLVIVFGGLAVLVSALILTGGSPARVLEVWARTTAGAVRVRELTKVPPSLALLPDAPATEGMVGYVRACTPPGSRVLVGGFAPQLYFFAERGFAGGMPVFFGGHWSSVQDQERTIEQLRREFVPLAIVDPAVFSTYDRVGGFLASTFVQVGVSSFGNPRAPARRVPGAPAARCRFDALRQPVESSVPFGLVVCRIESFMSLPDAQVPRAAAFFGARGRRGGRRS